MILTHFCLTREWGKRGDGQGACTSGVGGNGKQGAEPCCHERNFSWVHPTTLFLITICPFLGAKFWFPDKQNHCTRESDQQPWVAQE